jgi:CDP-glucose 4,6-dehydratase
LILSIVNPGFWAGKNVFLTGHTGFKGGWLTLWLSSMGARVTGYSLAPNSKPSIYDVFSLDSIIKNSCIADIRDLSRLKEEMSKAQPDVVIHMAAQALVRSSYLNPVETYSTNVMGTVNLLDSVRQISSVKSVVVVTSDKCYENKEWAWGYRENEPMGGFDPYSNSKGCAELITAAYRQSYFQSEDNALIATARAGNVIGGGDWSEDRLIPDAIKAFESSKPLIVRNRLAVRPWQHVLEPLSGYLILAEKLFSSNREFASAWNFGPNDIDARSVEDVINLLISKWGKSARWESEGSEQPHEAHLLRLDCSKAKQHLRWRPKWSLEVAIEKIVNWQMAMQDRNNMQDFSLRQIKEYTES